MIFYSLTNKKLIYLRKYMIDRLLNIYSTNINLNNNKIKIKTLPEAFPKPAPPRINTNFL